MSKIIVTGATGFIGSNLCRKLLKLGHEVHIICRNNSNLYLLNDIRNDIKIYKHFFSVNDLIDYFKKIKPDCVFHLASLSIKEHTEDDISNLIDSNIKFPTEILEAMKHSNTKYIINTSSYCQSFNDQDYKKMCLYGATKQAFEDILSYYSSSYDFKSITLKLYDIYGEHNKQFKLINKLNQASITNDLLKFKNPHQLINLTHIDDIIDAYIHSYDNLLKKQVYSHKVYTVCNSKFVTLKHVVQMYEKENNIKLNVSYNTNDYDLFDIVNTCCKYDLLPNFNPQISINDILKQK